MQVGVIGAGVVGGVLIEYFKSLQFQIKIKDPGLGKNDSLKECEAIFVCVPTPTTHGGQDLSIVNQVVNGCPDEIPIFIRSTVLPGTCDQLSVAHLRDVMAMPEFLTERTAKADFSHQGIIVGAVNKPRWQRLLNHIFPTIKLYFCKNLEAELTKYAHNCFGAVKVSYFNLIFLACQKFGVDFETVRKQALLSGYINSTHTLVPGPDGKLGYGGKCFPKDIQAFRAFCIKHGLPQGMLFAAETINAQVRYLE